ncbi:MAG: alpha/beta hydrolase [Pseudomonadota bacterium]|nr:alpha/beta hydrolase [Pseudomonadota bacterium]
MSLRRRGLIAGRGLAAALLLAGGAAAGAGPVLDSLPTTIDPSATYLLYLHGRIIEDRGPRAMHPQWGLYDLEAVSRALAARDAIVVARQRAPGSRVREDAEAVQEQVRALLAAGVPAPRIVVVGFSKGAAIAMLAAAGLPEPLRLVVLAGCAPGMRGPLTLSAHVLSIHERSDPLGESCAALLSGGGEASFTEIAIATGRSHGAFFLPQDEWVVPLLDWVHGTDPAGAEPAEPRPAP